MPSQYVWVLPVLLSADLDEIDVTVESRSRRTFGPAILHPGVRTEDAMGIHNGAKIAAQSSDGLVDLPGQ